jgi:hypothetical protein
MDAIEALKQERELLVRRLKNIDGAIGLLTDYPASGSRKPAGKRTVSAAARKKMSIAARKRWADKKKE